MKKRSKNEPKDILPPILFDKSANQSLSKIAREKLATAQEKEIKKEVLEKQKKERVENKKKYGKSETNKQRLDRLENEKKEKLNKQQRKKNFKKYGLAVTDYELEQDKEEKLLNTILNSKKRCLKCGMSTCAQMNSCM